MTEIISAPGAADSRVPAPGAEHDGARDFDFYHGRWRLRCRKLRDVLDPACEEWVEFGGGNEVLPVLGGLGNVEFSQNAYDPPFDGMTLRLYDPEAKLWRIWWASTRQPGELGPPAEGRFEGGRGVFLSDEILAGREVKVRIEWSEITDTSTHWEQSFSYDGGSTWRTNWITISTRETGRQS